MQLVYIYHNIIDATGDKANTEKDTFVADERNHIARIKMKQRTYSKRDSYRLIVRNIDKDTIEIETAFIIDIAIQDDFF